MERDTSEYFEETLNVINNLEKNQKQEATNIELKTTYNEQ